MTWKPVNDLTVRGSWGTSFRAPTMIESNPGVIGQTNRIYISNGSGDPAIPVTLLATGQSAVLDRTGTTAGLQPENATVWSLGTDFAPSFLPGFKASLTYYNVSYVDRIENLPNQSLVLSSAANRALYKNFIIVAPQPSTCVNGNYSTYNPLYIPFLTNKNAVYSPFTINDCTLTAIVNGGTQNLGNVKQDGLDFSADYRFETGLGRFTLSANFTKILNLKKSLLRNLPLFDALDTIGNQLSERGSARIGYNKDRFAANLTANYVGSFLNNATITVAGVKQPDAMVPAWTTVDGSFSYTIPENADGALAGTRFGLNVQNLTDKAPPIVLSGTNAVDGRYHNVFGRIVSFEISRKF
jgi:iron complex outermembrane receptor protein